MITNFKKFMYSYFTQIHWSLFKLNPEKIRICINRTLNKVPILEIIVNLIYVNQTHVYSLLITWPPKEVQFRQVSLSIHYLKLGPSKEVQFRQVSLSIHYLKLGPPRRFSLDRFHCLFTTYNLAPQGCSV
jgi:hypothetical protein